MKISVEEVQIIISLLDKNIEYKNSFINNLHREDEEIRMEVYHDIHYMYSWLDTYSDDIEKDAKRLLEAEIYELCILRTKLKEAKIVI